MSKNPPDYDTLNLELPDDELDAILARIGADEAADDYRIKIYRMTTEGMS